MDAMEWFMEATAGATVPRATPCIPCAWINIGRFVIMHGCSALRDLRGKISQN